MELEKLTIKELLEGYEKKTFRPSEVIGRMLSQIETKNSALNAYLEVRPEETKKRAEELDARLGEFSKLPLYGVPIAIKDNFLVKGWQCTAGSKILKGYRSPYTATSVARLEAAGAIVMGKANCDEFAMGSSNENSAYGPVRNPWNLETVPGGSSGGSAAVVAADLAAGSLGTDTGGSIRQPASLCGLVGVKPSYGRVSRFGIVSYASSLDQVGPFSKTMWDSARILEVMAGVDKHDATTSASPVPQYTAQLNGNSKPHFTIGISPAWLEGADPEVRKSFDSAIKLLQSNGAKVVEIDLPHSKYSLSTYYLIAPSECSSNLARYDGVHYGHRTQKVHSVEDLYSRSRDEGFGAEVKLRIMLGTYALSAGYYDAFYIKANQVRHLLQQDFKTAFQKCDVIAVPTSPTTAFKLGEKTDDPIKMYLSDIYTLPVNLAGLPGVSVPCGVDSKNLPIGLQFIGKAFDETNLFRSVASYEALRGKLPEPPAWKGGTHGRA